MKHQNSKIETLKPLKMEGSDLPLSGSLEDFSSRLVLSELHKQRFTGSIHLQNRDKSKKVWMKNGEVFRIQSNLKTELLGQLAVDRRLIQADALEASLKEQKRLYESQKNLRLGDVLAKNFSVSQPELDKLQRLQFVSSLIQSLSWQRGHFEIRSLSVNAADTPALSFDVLLRAVDCLFDDSVDGYEVIYHFFQRWSIQEGKVNLADFPLWVIFGSLKQSKCSGILSLRKQNQLFEVIVKEGLPMILYEGSFSHPRQTVLVRQTSQEHESYFRDQILYLFTLISGAAVFRFFNSDAVSNVDLDPIESTQVVLGQSSNSAHEDEMIAEDKSGFFARMVRLFHFR